MIAGIRRGSVTCRNVESRAGPQVVGGLLQHVAHAHEPGTDDEHRKGGVEDASARGGWCPCRGPGNSGHVVVRLHEEDERGDGDDDLRDDEGQVDEHVERRSPAALHARQGERREQPEHRGDDRRGERDLQAGDDGRDVRGVAQPGREPGRR